MKIATKTLTSLLIITMITLSSASIATATGADSAGQSQKKESRFERITRRHDRKMELRASVFGVTPKQLKAELSTHNFDQVLKKHGFKTRKAFRTAVAGKLKDELKKRGWSEEKIQKVVDKRLHRLEGKI